MEEFEERAHARSAALARSAWLLTTDFHHAEDLVQETLVRLADRWSQVARTGSPDAYARRVMHNLAIDRWRRRGRRPREVLADASERLHPHDPDPTTRLALQEALARLTPRQRAVLVLRFYEDLTEVATADVLGCSVSTVKSQTRHALQRLRELAPDVVAEMAEVSR